MNPLRRLHFAVESRFVLRHLLIQPRVFQRHRKIGRQDRQRLHVVGVEIIELRAFQIEHANHLALVHHGNRQLRPRLRIYHQVALILGYIGHQHGLPQRRRRAHKSFGRRHAHFALHSLPVLHIHSVPENVLLFVVQHDAQYLVIDDPLHLFRRVA